MVGWEPVAAAAHLIPQVEAASAVKTWASDPTPNLVIVVAADGQIVSPLV